MSAPERDGQPDAAAGNLEGPALAPAGVDGFRLESEAPAVMRLSRKTLAVLGGTAGIAIGGALLWALRPPSPKEAEELYSVATNSRSELVTGAPSNYGAVPKLGEPLPGDLGRPIVAARAAGANVPVPPIGTAPALPPDPRSAAAEQARQRAAQERTAARSSQLFLGGGGPTAASAPGLADVSGLPAAIPPPQPPETAAAAQRRFLGGGASKLVESGERLQSPSSAYVLQAGSVIPAALISGIRSDLPGQITAQVTQNIYDSPTGRFLLIPQGSRLIGEYDSEVAAGQSRVLLGWDRLILPGGRSIRLDRQPGTDAAGMAGLNDRVDNHWGRLLKAALVSTLTGIGGELVAGGDGDLVKALRYGVQDSSNETGRRIVERELAVAPSLTIRPGFAFRIVVTRDLILEPVDGEPW